MRVEGRGQGWSGKAGPDATTRPKARHPRGRTGTSSAAEAFAVLIAVLMRQSGSMATAHALDSKLCPSAPLRPRRESAALLVRLRLVWARAARVRVRVGVRVRVRVSSTYP